MHVFWFLPTHGDSRYLGTRHGGRAVTHNYLKQVAQAADELGFEGVLIPTGRSCEDAWVVASSLAPLTERLKFLVAIRPGIVSPTVGARMAATLDRLSDGRLLINVVTGGDPVELKGDGLFLDHAERYRLTAEFLRVWRALLAGETVNHQGDHLRVEGGQLFFPPVQRPYPPLWFGGSSDIGIEIAAEQIDTYLTWGEPVADVAGTRYTDTSVGAGNTYRYAVVALDTAYPAFSSSSKAYFVHARLVGQSATPTPGSSLPITFNSRLKTVLYGSSIW